jgi:hypothetical protein
MSEGDGGARPRLSRQEQRYNYGLAIVAVAVVVALTVLSPTIVVGGQRAPVLVVALLVGAFLFGLGQMVIGITRRRAFLKGLEAGGTQGSQGPSGGSEKGSV